MGLSSLTLMTSRCLDRSHHLHRAMNCVCVCVPDAFRKPLFLQRMLPKLTFYCHQLGRSECDLPKICMKYRKVCDFLWTTIYWAGLAYFSNRKNRTTASRSLTWQGSTPSDAAPVSLAAPSRAVRAPVQQMGHPGARRLHKRTARLRGSSRPGRALHRWRKSPNSLIQQDS